MPGKAAKVVISERQSEILQQFSTARTEPVFLQQRATIILLAFAGRLNEQIASQVNLERHQVGIWRTRWAEAFDRLILVECLEGTQALRDAIRALLADLPRPGAPGKFTPEQLAQLFALACEKPEKSGRPITHWTHAELADEAIKRGIVESISPRHLGRLLDEAALKPHRIRYWLNAKEKEEPGFVLEVQRVCQTYAEAPRLYAEANTHTLSTDEMTGIQALERIAETKPTKPGQEARMEYEGCVRRFGQRYPGFEAASGSFLGRLAAGRGSSGRRCNSQSNASRGFCPKKRSAAVVPSARSLT